MSMKLTYQQRQQKQHANWPVVARQESAQHTPGPWHIDGCVTGDDVKNNIYAANGDRVAVVCEYGPQSEMPHAQQANTRLIAAAPDLLAALYHAESALVARLPGSTALVQVRAAIARAKGV